MSRRLLLQIHDLLYFLIKLMQIQEISELRELNSHATFRVRGVGCLFSFCFQFGWQGWNFQSL